MNLRPFTRNDWFTFSRAERFPDGSEPMFGGLDSVLVTLDSGEAIALDAMVVLDAEGLEVSIADDETGARASVQFVGVFAARALAALRPWMSFSEIAGMAGASVLYTTVH